MLKDGDGVMVNGGVVRDDEAAANGGSEYRECVSADVWSGSVAYPEDDVRWLLTELRSDVRHTGMMIQAARDEVAGLRIDMDERFREHRDYHKKNESRWGAVRWLEKHPWATVLIMLAVLTGVRDRPELSREVLEAVRSGVGDAESVGGNYEIGVIGK